MNALGELEAGDVFRMVNGDLWYVDSTSPSGAYCIGLSAHPGPITTKKRITKIVNRHQRNMVVSLRSAVDLVDKATLNQRALDRRLDMARKQVEGGAAVAEQETAAVRPPKELRVASKFKLTGEKPAKELRGQGKEVFVALETAGKALTIKEIADRCEFPNSRQDKERVAGFYVSQFKKNGLIVDEAPKAVPA